MVAARRLFLIIFVVLLPSLTSCGGVWGTDDTSFPPPEKSTLKVGGLKLTDSIPLLLARDRGYFRDEGLDVQMAFGEKGSVNLKNTMDGTTDLALTSYPGPITKQADGARLKVVADAVQTTPGLIQTVVPANSDIESVEDLAHKRIATSSPRGITELTTDVQLKMRGINPHTVTFVSMEIATMPAALKNGTVDAAGVAEPFVQQAFMDGAVAVLDPFSGPTADFPWSGYVATEEFTKKYPHTIAAFQRALNRAVEEVRGDRTIAERLAVRYLDVDQRIATLMTLPEYPTSVDPVRLQRVADMLYESGEIPKHLDMRVMVLAADRSD